MRVNPRAFPKSHQLVVTTASGVYSWSRDGVTEVFKSESDGIVAAKWTASNKDMLAVADSRVVVLHDVRNGQRQHSYTLKRKEVRRGKAPTADLTHEAEWRRLQALLRRTIGPPVLHDETGACRPVVLST